MTISVAIATYNRSAMVREAVEAVMAQSHAPDEIVIADDASTDDTPLVLAGMVAANARVRVIRQSANLGGVANWNAAMAATRGDLIAWCADDDRFLARHLKASMDYLAAHPETGLVHSSFVDSWETPQGVAQEGQLLRSARPLVLDRRRLLRYLTRYHEWPFHPSTLVMRREVWERTGPFDAAYALANVDWFVRAAEQFRVVMLPRYGVLNRRHPVNGSNRASSVHMQAETFQIVERALLRRWPHGGARRVAWRAVWRANVRLRLLLTMRDRIAAGHGEAAAAAWETLTKGTGTRAMEWLNRPGQQWIRWSAGRHSLASREGRRSVSPL